MNEIAGRFNDKFRNWNITLPPEALVHRKRGKICKGGWAIWYLFGSDESGEYLDYYASHRMTSDQHLRIYTDGRYKELPALCEWHLCSKDPVENARLVAEYQAENQRVAEMLEAKGFGLQGDEPNGVQINRFLRLQKSDEHIQENLE